MTARPIPPPGRPVQPPYLPPRTGRTCSVCGEDELNHREFGLVCRHGHKAGCACEVHDGTECPELRPIRNGSRA